MKIALFKTSNKENERRLPIHPEHLAFLPSSVWPFLYLEKGYGTDFGLTDRELSDHCSGFMERKELFSECDILILPKPTISDIEAMHEGQVLWGWIHCVQQFDIAQKAIEKKITVVAWEAMNHWDPNGRKSHHIFYKNNELAGYAAVLHVLELLGLDGHYGPRQKVSLISYGSVTRGAIYALQGRGFNNLHVFTRRPPYLVADQNPDVYFYHLDKSEDHFYAIPQLANKRLLIDELMESEIIINGILQDPLRPEIFLKTADLPKLKRNTIIVDISCDEGMGFEFAIPTTFKKPILVLTNGIKYYSVDHVPSYLWNSASREISKALTPFLIDLIRNSFDFHCHATLSKAIEIEQGTVLNPNILDFQKRERIYPYNRLKT